MTAPGAGTVGSSMPDGAALELMAEVARRHYLAEESKVDIGKALGLSRFKVARVLADARRTGVVRITIAVPAAVETALSHQLAEVLGVPRCVVVEDDSSEEQTRRRVAVAAAGLLPKLVRPGDLVGLAWSRAVDAMVDSLDHLPSCTAVQLAGSLAGSGPSTVDLVQRAARLSGGTAHALHAPLVVDDPALAVALRRQAGIRQTFAMVDRLDVSVVAVGAWRAGRSTVWEAVPAAVRRAGTRAGAVAEVCGRLLDADGTAVDTVLDDLVLAATLEQLRRPRARVALVSGAGRGRAVVAAVRAGLVTALVTTSQTAREVLDAQG